MKKELFAVIAVTLLFGSVPALAEDTDAIISMEDETENIVEMKIEENEVLSIISVDDATTEMAEMVDTDASAATDETESVEINSDNFPDKIFRDYVSDNCDTDGDGELSQTEISDVTYINVDAMTIFDLTGIEYFTDLEYLECSSNSLTSIDLSKNTKLSSLYCAANNLTSLDLSNNSALKILDCYENDIMELDLNNNTMLTDINCSGNILTSLKVNGCLSLAKLNCSDNKLESLDISSCGNLTDLYCYTNDLTDLDVSNNAELINLYCQENNITELELDNNTKLECLYCGYNNLTALNLEENTELLYLDCKGNNLSSLNISNNTYLRYLFCYQNNLTNIDLTQNSVLLQLDCSKNSLSSLDISKNAGLEYLACANNNITNLDLTANVNLTFLDCASNDLGSLDLSKNKKLVYLYCYSNHLTSLNLEQMDDLESMEISSQNITVLAVWSDDNWCINLADYFAEEEIDSLSVDSAYAGSSFSVSVSDGVLAFDSITLPSTYLITFSVALPASTAEMQIYLTITTEDTASIDINKCSLYSEYMSDDYIYNGEEKTLYFELSYNDEYYLTEGTDYTVTYDDNVNAGLVTATISGTGIFTGSITQTFTIKKADQNGENSAYSGIGIEVGKTAQITSVTGIGEITYVSADSSIADVDDSGLVTGISEGSTAIVVTVAGNNNYNGFTVEIPVEVISAGDSSTSGTTGTEESGTIGTGSLNYDVESETESQTSNTEISSDVGNSQETETLQGLNLTEDSGNTTVSIGIVKSIQVENTTKGIAITWAAADNAEGYNIYRKTGSGTYQLVVSVNSSVLTYTDTAVKSKNGTVYSYKITPYFGTTEGTGTVKNAVRLVSVKLSSVKSKAAKRITVKWKKTTKVTGYQIQYSTSKTFKKGNKTVKVSGAKKTSKTISKLKSGKKYYIRIRTYKKVNGVTYYSAWSSKKKVTVS
ncbi:MAG: fibronectin type III domain-containing protein [Lachnospiraceae bacterium]|nr:fibronectin type III domain-containing protein [Lachnospiraceae bacterium]